MVNGYQDISRATLVILIEKNKHGLSYAKASSAKLNVHVQCTCEMCLCPVLS